MNVFDLRHVNVMRAGRFVLHDLSLRIAAMERTAIVGPNGSGKSSLIKLITRECYPVQAPESSMTIFDRETWNIFELRKLLGIVSADLSKAFDQEMTGREAILSGFFSGIGLSVRDEATAEMEQRTREILTLLEAGHLAERSVAQMSTGEARRILIARALAHDPKMLVLDEPTTGLDARAHRDLLVVLGRLATEGIGLLLVTHDFNDIIPEIERVLFIRDGRIVADDTRETLLTDERLSQLFETEIRLLPASACAGGTKAL